VRGLADSVVGSANKELVSRAQAMCAHFECTARLIPRLKADNRVVKVGSPGDVTTILFNAIGQYAC